MTLIYLFSSFYNILKLASKSVQTINMPVKFKMFLQFFFCLQMIYCQGCTEKCVQKLQETIFCMVMILICDTIMFIVSVLFSYRVCFPPFNLRLFVKYVKHLPVQN